MANVLHSTLTGGDLHEVKGAASAAVKTVPIANGTGGAPFGFVSYTDITNKPTIPAVSYNNVAVVNSLTKIYTGVAAAGLWSIPITGFGTVYSVQATALAGGTALGTACVANVAAATTTLVTGSVIVLNSTTNTLGTTQQIQIVVRGV